MQPGGSVVGHVVPFTVVTTMHSFHWYRFIVYAIWSHCQHQIVNSVSTQKLYTSLVCDLFDGILVVQFDVTVYMPVRHYCVIWHFSMENLTMELPLSRYSVTKTVTLSFLLIGITKLTSAVLVGGITIHCLSRKYIHDYEPSSSSSYASKFDVLPMLSIYA